MIKTINIDRNILDLVHVPGRTNNVNFYFTPLRRTTGNGSGHTLWRVRTLCPGSLPYGQIYKRAFSIL